MSQRTHNIYFHLHTVSGITISFALFIIFFAGAFTLFHQPAENWENATKIESKITRLDAMNYSKVFSNLERKGENLYGRTIHFGEIKGGTTKIYLYPSKDTISGSAKQKEYILNCENYQLTRASEQNEFTVSELLYLLHFYYQLDRPGYYLAGFVSFFFLFALISGLIVHWKKIKLNFFVFRPKEKLKTVWTDLHTTLGVIGLPFQFMYALTGTMFGLSIILAMAGSTLYDGNINELYADLFPQYKEREIGSKTNEKADYSACFQLTKKEMGAFHYHEVSFYNFGTSTEELKIHGEVNPSESFHSETDLCFDVVSQKLIYSNKPEKRNYENKVWSSVYRLHFAEFGELGTWHHYIIKIVYFLLAILSCLVIISGVLIWLEARNKKNISDKKRKYNNRVGVIFLSICYSLLPVTMSSFLISKCLPHSYVDKSIILNSCFFGLWLVTMLFFIWKNNNPWAHKFTMRVTAIISLTLPILNGIIDENWLWTTISEGNHSVFMFDLFCLFIGFGCWIVYKKSNRFKYAPA